MPSHLESAQPAGTPPPQVSIVVPLFNEEGNLLLLYESIRDAMRASGFTWEVVFVDDGSKDSTFSILRRLAKVSSKADNMDPIFRGVQTAKN